MTLQKNNVLIYPLYLFALIPLLGFFPHEWPLGTALADGAGLLWGGLLLGLLWYRNTENSIAISPLFYAAIAWLVIIVISVLANTFSQSSAWVWHVVYASFALAVVLATSELMVLVGRKTFVSTLINALYWGVLIFTVISLAQYYGLLKTLQPWLNHSSYRLTGLWEQPNLTSTMIWVGVASACFKYARQEAGITFFASVLVFGLALALAASRTSWLMAVAFVLLAAWGWLPKWRGDDAQQVRKNMMAAVGVIVVLLLVALPVQTAVGTWLYEQGWISSFQAGLNLTERDIAPDSARVNELRKLVAALPELSVKQWLLGVGPGQYSLFSSPLDYTLPVEAIGNQTWTHSHNIFTMFFVEYGLLGVIFLLAVFGLLAFEALRHRFEYERFFLILGLAILFIHSNLEYPLWYAWFLFLFVVFATALLPTKQVQLKAEVQVKKRLSLLVLAVTVLLSLSLVLQYQRILSAKKASATDVAAYQSLLFMTDNSLMGPYATLVRFRKFAPEAGAFTEQMAEVEQMLAWQPRDMVMVRKYSLHLLMRDYKAACEQAELTAFRFPRSGPIMLEHVQLLGQVPKYNQKQIEACVINGLAKRGETLESAEEKNKEYLERNR